MRTIFISDLHLGEQLPFVTEKFRELLTNLSSDIEALYILGDLFEVWIGDDEETAFQQEISKLIKTASLHCPIYFMPGNRDFLLGKAYCELSGMTYLRDPSCIHLYKQKTLLLHGDSLCKQDKLHQYYRFIVRSRFFKRVFLSLPLSYRKTIALKMRQRSKQRNQAISDELMDIDSNSLKKLMKKQQCTQAIYGHTHRPSIYYFDIETELKKVFVLSDWHSHGNTLEFDATGFSSMSYF